MATLLFLTSSLSGAESKSRTIAGEIVAGWRNAHPDGRIVERNLVPATMPHLDEQTLGALMTQADKRSAEQAGRVALADELIEELEAADTIVLAVPMYNFGIPSALKAWIDHIARAGRTFRYTAQGPQGLLTGKKVYVVTAHGGVYSSGLGQALDFVGPYLRTVLGFVGITDVEIVQVEGLNISPQAATDGIARARDAVGALFQQAAAA